MNTSNNLNQPEALEAALTAALGLIEDMDRYWCTTGEILPVVPDVIFWMMKHTSPELADAVSSGGQRETLTDLLAEHATLRDTAEQRRATCCSNEGADAIAAACIPHRLTLWYLAESVLSESGSKVTPVLRNAIASNLQIDGERRQNSND
jgi:hypothetical protein